MNSFSIGISYQHVLEKPPETKDVYNVVKYISALWNELGREFDVPENDRASLRRNTSLSDEDRLESVLSKWIRTETTSVKWRVVLEALNALGRKDMIKKVIAYLEKPVESTLTVETIVTIDTTVTAVTTVLL